MTRMHTRKFPLQAVGADLQIRPRAGLKTGPYLSFLASYAQKTLVERGPV